MKKVMIVCATAIFMILAGMTTADVPRTISYQGFAKDASGNPVPDGSYFVRFYIYNAPEGGTALWFEFTIESPNVTTHDGYFNWLLGSIVPIPDSLFANYDSLYLQVRFDGQNLTPRTPLVTSGYSFRVNSVDGAIGGTITGDLIIDAAAGNSALDLPNDAISRLEIWDEPGVAQAVNDTIINIPWEEAIDLITVDITIPRAGYILVYGKANLHLSSTVRMQIDQTSGGSISDVSSSYVSIDGNTIITSPFCLRIYYKMIPGTYTFRLEAYRTGDWAYAEDKTLTAMFIPTSYGSVETMLSSEELGELGGDTTPMGTASNGNTKVDLRQLELKAAKAEADAERANAQAERAKRQLLEAQIEQSSQQ